MFELLVSGCQFINMPARFVDVYTRCTHPRASEILSIFKNEKYT